MTVTSPRRISWKGLGALKGSVLSQMRAHRDLGRLDSIEVQGQGISLYGWPKPADFSAICRALHIPQDLLSLGYYLWDGYPECIEGIRDVIDARRTFLEAVPVGADLTGVATELVSWRLVDDRWGMARTVDDARVVALVEELALSLLNGELKSGPTISALLEEWRAEIPRQWKRDRHVDSEVHQHVRVLETAFAACELRLDPTRAGRVVEISIFGANGASVIEPEATEAAMQGELLRLLGASGGW